jgi:indole-3-glycerol phosphate synthase
MRDILDEIVAYKLKEVEKFKKELSQVYLESRVEIIRKSEVASMSLAVRNSTTGIIAEVKRKSPSKGWIAQTAIPEKVAYSYQNNGATALSILTDSEYFGGSNAHIRLARQEKVYLPILYKNFIIDEYQIYQAKVCGASAILLIAACLTKEQCAAFIQKAHELKLEVLLEMHSEEETEYAELGPDMCGINNRNLGTFETDVNNSFNLIERLPADAVKVSESGISDVETIRRLKEVGYHGFLIGETFMKEPDPGLALQQFVSKLS